MFAVIPFQRGRDDRRHCKIDPADSLKSVLDKVAFGLQLGGVIDMLQLAATAGAEMGAFGLDPMGALFIDRDQSPESVGFLFLGQIDGDNVLRGCKRDEDDEAVIFKNAISAKRQIFNGSFNQNNILWG